MRSFQYSLQPFYRSQGQTIPYVIVDIASPPSGVQLTLFSLYVALSRSSGRETIRILSDFDDSVFLKSHDCNLLAEDDRLEHLDRLTTNLLGGIACTYKTVILVFAQLS